MSPEEDRTRDAVDSKPKHYQWAIPAPHVPSSGLGIIMCWSCATHQVMIVCNTSSDDHVQHIKCWWCATHQVLMMCNTSSADHVQHIKCRWCATHQVLMMCNAPSAGHVQHIKCWSCATHQVLVMCNTSSADHMQHIKCWSCATCHVVSHMVQRDSSAINFDRVKIAFILALVYWQNH